MTAELDWVEQIGAPAMASLREMVAALECDYERLEELRDERDGYEVEDADANTAPDGPGYANDREAWAGEHPDDARELAGLEAAAGGCADREDAERRIQEDPLSIEVRSGWTSVGDEMEADEFCILLTTGSPAVRIVGDLDSHGEPHAARLEVQDWFKPWTEYEPATEPILLTYARCFVYTA